MSYLDEVNSKKADQAEAKFKQQSLESFDNLSTQIKTLLDSLEKTGAKTLDKDFIKAVKGLEKVSSSLSDIRVTSDDDIKQAIQTLAYVLANLDVKPTVNVPAPKVIVNEREISFAPLIKAINSINVKAPEVKVDVGQLTTDIKAVEKAIKGLRFPTSNFILPFKNTQGAASQVQLDPSGNVPVSGTITVDTSNVASSANQTNGDQKTQIVDPGGEAATVTDGKLDVNATLDTTGLATSAKQDEQTALLTTIDADTSTLAGTVTDSKVQTDVVTMPTVTVQATNLDIRDLNSASDSVTTVPSGTQTISGTVTANAGTNLNTSALALESGGNLAAIATSAAVLDDWDESDRAKVNPIVGQAGVQGGSGSVSNTTQRVVLATDVALPAGTNAIGKLSANSGVDIGDVDVTSAVTSTMDHGSNQDIDTSAEQITATSFACKFGVTLRADTTNTAIIWIGNSDVTVGGTAATDGMPLSPGDSLFLPVTNSNIPYAIASANNQKIYWIAA